MIVVMKPGATEAQTQHVVELVREYGLKDHVIHGTDRTVVACIGCAFDHRRREHPGTDCDGRGQRPDRR